MMRIAVLLALSFVSVAQDYKAERTVFDILDTYQLP